jgi:hypothetical protein
MKNPLESLIDSLAHLPRPVHLPYGILPPLELPLTTEYDLNALPSSLLRAQESPNHSQPQGSTVNHPFIQTRTQSGNGRP